MRNLNSIILLFFLLFCIGSASAITENLQSWGSSQIGGSYNIVLFNSSSGEVTAYLLHYLSSFVINANPVQYTYAAFDTPYNYQYVEVYLLDSNFNTLAQYGFAEITGRIEINIVGGAPTYYGNGILLSTGSVINVNPSYLEITSPDGGGACNIDNIVIGNSDPHVVGALPSNWTIQRDLINPAATGVYAWNNSSSNWTLTNSQYFYIDADTSSQQSVTTENFDILNYDTGLIVNTTVIHDQSSPRNQLQFNIANFLNTITNLGTQLPDGEYTAEFRGYPTSAAYFWVISSGATVNWNKATYAQGDTATLTYAVSNSYWQTSTYNYNLVIVSTTGTTLQTYALTSQTGTESLQLNPTTYPPGAYYAEVTATPVAGGTAQIINYAAAQVTNYVYLGGYVMNAETGAVLQNANVSVSQSGTNVSALTSAAGLYNISTGLLAGSTISVVTNLTGFTTDTNSFTPLSAGTINLNISLLSTTPAFSGTAISGILRDNQYGNPIPAATVYLVNGTQVFSNTTNIAGYYYENGLTHGNTYTISGLKAGYANTTLPQVSV